MWSSGIAEAEVLYSYVVKVQPAVIPGRLLSGYHLLLLVFSFGFLLDGINPLTKKHSRLHLWLVDYDIRKPGTEN